MFGEATIIAVVGAVLGMAWKINTRLTRLETRQEAFNDFIVEILTRVLPDGQEIIKRYVSYHRALAGKGRTGSVPTAVGSEVAGR